MAPVDRRSAGRSPRPRREDPGQGQTELHLWEPAEQPADATAELAPAAATLERCPPLRDVVAAQPYTSLTEAQSSDATDTALWNVLSQSSATRRRYDRGLDQRLYAVEEATDAARMDGQRQNQARTPEELAQRYDAVAHAADAAITGEPTPDPTNTARAAYLDSLRTLRDTAGERAARLRATIAAARPRPGRGRTHSPARVRAATAAGGHCLSQTRAPPAARRRRERRPFDEPLSDSRHGVNHHRPSRIGDQPMRQPANPLDCLNRAERSWPPPARPSTAWGRRCAEGWRRTTPSPRAVPSRCSERPTRNDRPRTVRR